MLMYVTVPEGGALFVRIVALALAGPCVLVFAAAARTCWRFGSGQVGASADRLVWRVGALVGVVFMGLALALAILLAAELIP